MVICSWLISKNATQYVGALKFQLSFACVTKTNPDYVWSTAVYAGITVQEAILDFDVEEDGEWVDYLNDEVSVLGEAELGEMVLGEGD